MRSHEAIKSRVGFADTVTIVLQFLIQFLPGVEVLPVCLTQSPFGPGPSEVVRSRRCRQRGCRALSMGVGGGEGGLLGKRAPPCSRLRLVHRAGAAVAGAPGAPCTYAEGRRITA